MKNKKIYRPPPIVEIFIAHTILMELIGVFFPESAFVSLYFYMRWLVQRVPNISILAIKSGEAVFAEAFLALSLLFGFIWLIVAGFFFRSFHAKTFNSLLERLTVVVLIICSALLFSIALWYVPFGDPVHGGRAWAVLSVAAMGKFGIILVANLIIVGIPLFFFLIGLAGMLCTNSQNK